MNVCFFSIKIIVTILNDQWSFLWQIVSHVFLPSNSFSFLDRDSKSYKKQKWFWWEKKVMKKYCYIDDGRGRKKNDQRECWKQLKKKQRRIIERQRKWKMQKETYEDKREGQKEKEKVRKIERKEGKYARKWQRNEQKE